jgi:DNA-directed RNA polymerase specialized sigma24 family protein
MFPGREEPASPGNPIRCRTFATTHWSVVLATRDSEPDRARQALERLCATYWYPIYACVRRNGNNHDDAEDLTQGFFERLLCREAFQHLEPARGRLRSFLWVALRRYLQDVREKEHTQRRGGNRKLVSLDKMSACARYRCEPVDRWNPEQLFERRWAVALLDSSDQPRITDFGLAKRLTGSITSLTLTGEALGSPNFMPPEQAAGRHKLIGPARDVYGLGAILYYLVTSRPPFVADNLTAAVRQVQEQEPVSPRMLNPGVPKDLETICLKCLQKEPTKRYATAGELAAELDRFRRGEPILARPVGPAGRLWRWCRRRPALAAALAAVMALAGLSTTAAVRMALAQEGRERERYRANIQLAAARIEEGSIDVALETLLGCPERFRHWEWGYLVAQCHREVLSLEEARTNIFVGLFAPEWRCGFSADGKRVGAVHPGGIVQVWERSSGKPVWNLRESVDPAIGGVSLD